MTEFVRKRIGSNTFWAWLPFLYYLSSDIGDRMKLLGEFRFSEGVVLLYFVYWGGLLYFSPLVDSICKKKAGMKFEAIAHSAIIGAITVFVSLFIHRDFEITKKLILIALIGFIQWIFARNAQISE